MTVAESLRDKLKYNMMMNHDSIEMSGRIFGFGTPAQKEFNAVFREKAFEVPQEKEYLTGLEESFRVAGGEFYFVELSADLATRLERNETPHRMERKASKRDIVWSRSNLLKDAANHRLNSEEGEICFKNHIKIDNTSLSPDQVADMVIEGIKLVANEKDEKGYRFGV